MIHNNSCPVHIIDPPPGIIRHCHYCNLCFVKFSWLRHKNVSNIDNSGWHFPFNWVVGCGTEVPATWHQGLTSVLLWNPHQLRNITHWKSLPCINPAMAYLIWSAVWCSVIGFKISTCHLTLVTHIYGSEIGHHLWGDKPLLEPMLIHCQSDLWGQTLVKFPKSKFIHLAVNTFSRVKLANLANDPGALDTTRNIHFCTEPSVESNYNGLVF